MFSTLIFELGFSACGGAMFAIARGGDFAQSVAERGDRLRDSFADYKLAFAAATDQVGIGENFHVVRDGGGCDAAHRYQILALHAALRGDGFENLEAGFIAQRLRDFLDLGPVHRHGDSIIRFRGRDFISQMRICIALNRAEAHFKVR